ncbi:AraC-like DNA-binding protein [Pseudomonas sp. JAI115]|uniref:helix-turn-helix transcriptional regulator n=1 Tax=Pseudomonas sp. JAI115 TaxID=2723061 RepID=UPI00160A9202|nr:AraC family transcriptional regulator [Pseudomonas sp. JAI115]MBB6155181.1 AraC-like DNA-binding protein [Pseudomonas sp. JAI115]
MQEVRLLFTRCGGNVRIGPVVEWLPAYSLALQGGNVGCEVDASICRYDFHPADFKRLYTEVSDLLTPAATVSPASMRVVQVQDELIRVLELLAQGTPEALLRFAYVYCLGVDRRYFSALLHHLLAGDHPFFEFIENHALNQWPVARYALELDIPLRKFNALFQEKYGSPAKRWFLEKRLARSRELLLSTPLRVLDIALECGFANHGHFTESFRKRYRCNPSQYRQQAQALLTPPNRRPD